MLIPVLKSSPSWLKQPVEGAAFLNLIPDTVPRIFGLPNITGFSNIAGYFDPLTAAGGALSASTRWTFTIMREPGTASGIVNFNAAGSNPIYGASTTNQPAAIRGYWLIRFN